MATYYVDSGAGALEMTNRTWATNELMVPLQSDTSTNHLIAKQWIWECTTAGTSTGTPTWPASVTDDVTTVTNNGVEWTARAPDNWTHAMPGIYYIVADVTTKRMVANDTIYVKNTHVRNLTVAQDWHFPETGVNKLLSVDASLNLVAGAKETSTGGNVNTCVQGFVYAYGLIIEASTNSTKGVVSVGSRNNNSVTADCRQVWDNCLFYPAGNTSGSSFNLGHQNNLRPNYLELRNCTLKGRHAATTLGIVGGMLTAKIYNLTFDNSGTAQTAPFYTSDFYGLPQLIEVVSSDFSFCTTALVNWANITTIKPFFYKFINCKIPSAVTTGTRGTATLEIECLNCSNSDTTIYYYKDNYYGITSTDTGIYLTTGASQAKEQNGTLTSFSLKTITNSNTTLIHSFELPWVSVFIGSTGSKTVSMKIAYDNATALKDSEIWIEVDYYGSTSSPLSTIEGSFPIVSGTKSRDILAAGSSLSDTSEAWTGTSGWTNKKTHTLSKTVTVNQQGYIRCRVVIGKASQTVYVNQSITVT